MNSIGARFGIAGELLHFLWTQKAYWLIPLVIMLLMVAVLIAFASSSALAPFIYPLI